MKRGQIVYSKAGRDKDRFMVVLNVCDARCAVADGKERKVEKPKLKNIKHLGATNHYIAEPDLLTNRSVRKQLKQFSEHDDSERGHSDV